MPDARDAGMPSTSDLPPPRLRDALRRVRIESAGQTGGVVDLRDAEVARLEILNDALDPIFAEIPDRIDLFDRGVSQGETPRLWIDVVAHVVMGRDKRAYRLVQDNRYGRLVLAESHEVAVMVQAITDYVARRMVERERALATTPTAVGAAPKPRSRVLSFTLGVVVGMMALFAIALVASLRRF